MYSSLEPHRDVRLHYLFWKRSYDGKENKSFKAIWDLNDLNNINQRSICNFCNKNLRFNKLKQVLSCNNLGKTASRFLFW